MKRDGEKKSLWQDSIEDYKPVNNWQKDKVYDVLIVGGGITGLTTALVLQMEGKKCILAEAHNIGFGTTGGTTAHLNTMLDTPYNEIEKDFGLENAKLVAKGAREGIDLIEDLTDVFNINSEFAYKSGYLFAQTEEEANELDKIKTASQRAGAVTSCSDSIPVPIAFKKAIRFEFQGQIHPIKYLAGLAQAFEKEGGVLLQECMVNSVENGQHFTANTSLGEIKASIVIYATHMPPGLNILHLHNAPYRSYVAAFTLKNGNHFDGLAYDMKDPYHYFRMHTINGKRYVIGGGFDRKTGHNSNTEYTFTELEAYLHNYFDIASVDYKWSAQYYVPNDGLPYIGLLPGHDKIYVATGFGGNGMTLGSLAAKILCGLIVNKDSPYEKLFSPSRIKPIAGFTDFVKENADVVSQFIGKRFSYEKVSELVELAPGEAKVAIWEDKKVALYKDENGRIHALDPVCPHAKCIVTWNNAERSWDCPCHGGRYAPNGDFLSGPATHGLTQIQWEGIDGD